MSALGVLGKLGLGIGRAGVGVTKSVAGLYGRSAMQGMGLPTLSRRNGRYHEHDRPASSRTSGDVLTDIQQSTQSIDRNTSQNSALLNRIAVGQGEVASNQKSSIAATLATSAAVAGLGTLITKFFTSDPASAAPAPPPKPVGDQGLKGEEQSYSALTKMEYADPKPMTPQEREYVGDQYGKMEVPQRFIPTGGRNDIQPISHGKLNAGRAIRIAAETITFKADVLKFKIGAGNGSFGGGSSGGGFQRVAYSPQGGAYFPQMGGSSRPNLGSGSSGGSTTDLGSVSGGGSAIQMGAGSATQLGSGSGNSLDSVGMATGGRSRSTGQSDSAGSPQNAGASPMGNKMTASTPGFDAQKMISSGVDPLLVESTVEAAKKTFGDPADKDTRYVLSTGGGGGAGMSRGGVSKHNEGKAIDLQIYDRKMGAFVGQNKTGSSDIMKNAFGNKETYAIYDALSRSRYDYVKEKYGESAAGRMSSGTRFIAKQGAIDQMHQSIDEGGRIGPLSQAPNLNHRMPNGQTLGDWLGKGNQPTEDYATKYREKIDASSPATASAPTGDPRRDAFNKIRDMAIKAGSKNPDITAAIAMHESGWLDPTKKNVFTNSGGTNPFGQTAKPGDPNMVIGKDGQPHKVYGSLEEGVKHHVERWNDRYDSDPNKALDNLRKGGYNSVSPQWRGAISKNYLEYGGGQQQVPTAQALNVSPIPMEKPAAEVPGPAPSAPPAPAQQKAAETQAPAASNMGTTPATKDTMLPAITVEPPEGTSNPARNDDTK